jgi:hypothetical protein
MAVKDRDRADLMLEHKRKDEEANRLQQEISQMGLAMWRAGEALAKFPVQHIKFENAPESLGDNLTRQGSEMYPIDWLTTPDKQVVEQKVLKLKSLRRELHDIEGRLRPQS